MNPRLPLALTLGFLLSSVVQSSAGERQIYYDHQGRPVGTVKASNATAAKPTYPTAAVSETSHQPMSRSYRRGGLYRPYPYGYGYGYPYYIRSRGLSCRPIINHGHSRAYSCSPRIGFSASGRIGGSVYRVSF